MIKWVADIIILTNSFVQACYLHRDTSNIAIIWIAIIFFNIGNNMTDNASLQHFLWVSNLWHLLLYNYSNLLDVFFCWKCLLKFFNFSFSSSVNDSFATKRSNLTSEHHRVTWITHFSTYISWKHLCWKLALRTWHNKVISSPFWNLESTAWIETIRHYAKFL